AAIGKVEILADPEALPVLAAVGAREDLARGARKHGFAAVDHDSCVVDVGVSDAGDPRPGLAAVAAAAHSVDFDARPNRAVIRRMAGQRGTPRDAAIWAFFGHFRRELVPTTAAVARAEEGRRPRASEDDLRIGRIERDLPDVQRIHR